MSKNVNGDGRGRHLGLHHPEEGEALPRSRHAAEEEYAPGNKEYDDDAKAQSVLPRRASMKLLGGDWSVQVDAFQLDPAF